MRFLRVGDPGEERPAVEDDGQVFDLSPVTGDIDGTFLAGDGVSRVRDALGRGALPRRDLAGQRLGPPVARPGR